jgi:hypothetical protein
LALADVDKKLKNVMKTLDSVTSQFLSEKESWEKDLASLEENWRCKITTLYFRILSPSPSMRFDDKKK